MGYLKRIPKGFPMSSTHCSVSLRTPHYRETGRTDDHDDDTVHDEDDDNDNDSVDDDDDCNDQHACASLQSGWIS